MKNWTETLHTQRPELLKKYKQQVDKLIAEAIEPILASAADIHPTVDDALMSQRGSVMILRAKLRDAGEDIFDGINVVAKAAHRSVKPQVESAWKSTYTKCRSEKRKGHFEENKKAHKAHIQGDGGVPMFKKAGSAIQRTMNTALKKLPEKFEANFQKNIIDLRDTLKITLDRHTIGEGGAEAGVAGKKKLDKILKLHFDNLENSWGMEPEPEIEEDKVADVGLDDVSDIEDYNLEEYE